MQSLFAELVDSVVAMPSEFATVVGNDPVSAVLVAVGTLLMVVSFGVLGYLTLGAVVEFLTPDLGGRAPPQADR